MTSWVAVTDASHGGDATFDWTRLEAANARAERRWSEAQFDRLPISFDRARIDEEMAAYSNSVIVFVADALLDANPSKQDLVLEYVNSYLVPFIVSHKDQYLCLMREHYYNFDVPADRITSIEEPGLSWIFEIAYVLLNTEKERERLGIEIPGGDWKASMQSMRSFVQQYGWTTKSSNKLRLDCAKAVTSQLFESAGV